MTKDEKEFGEETFSSDDRESVRAEEGEADRDPQSDTRQQEPAGNGSSSDAEAPEDDEDQDARRLAVVDGPQRPKVDMLLLDQLMQTSRGTGSEKDIQVKRTAGAIELFQDFNPTDATESVTARLAVGLTNASMDCIDRAGSISQTQASRETELKSGMKIASTVVELLTLMDKHRRSSSRVKVGSVNVATGGRAIVGNIQSSAKREADPAPSAAEDPSVEEDDT